MTRGLQARLLISLSNATPSDGCHTHACHVCLAPGPVLYARHLTHCCFHLQPYISNICVTSSSSGSSYPAYGSSYPPPATSSASPLPDTQTAAGRRRLLNEVLSHLGRQLLAGGSPEPCPEGKRHLFPKGSIATAHYLLFFVALVHILYSLLTFTLTLHRVGMNVLLAVSAARVDARA